MLLLAYFNGVGSSIKLQPIVLGSDILPILY